MKRIAIVSDTHLPLRAPEMPDEFERRVLEADHVVHAGDFSDTEILERFEEMADGNFTGVYGNTDPLHFGRLLSEHAVLEVEGVAFVVTHGTGSPTDFEERVSKIVREQVGDHAVGIAGHTHTPIDTVFDGIRILNPGSATGAPGRPTMMTADVDGEDLDVTLHEGTR